MDASLRERPGLWVAWAGTDGNEVLTPDATDLPYPIHTGHFPGGRPTAEADYLFAGGAHQRDWKTLGAAARLLGPRPRPIRTWTPQPVPPPPPITEAPAV